MGKVICVWKITYDGKDSVRFHCDGLLCGGDLPTAHLKGATDAVDIDAGLGDHFRVSRRSDGAVNVKWPWGWNYRPYKS